MLLKATFLIFFNPHLNFWVILTAKWKEVSTLLILQGHLTHIENLLEQKVEPFCDSLGASFRTNISWSFEKSKKPPFEIFHDVISSLFRFEAKVTHHF